MENLNGNGQFFYDKRSQNLYVKPLDPVTSISKTFHIGRQENIFEIKQARINNLTVRDLEIDLANRYGIGVWWQGDKQIQGSVLVENNTFIGNAYSAVCLSGGMNYDMIAIRNNTIRQSGAEGIYIGKYATRKSLDISDNRIGDPSDPSFGWAGAGPTSAFNGDGIDIKKGNRNVTISRNTIRNLTSGGCGICSHSSALIIDNFIEKVRLPGTFSAGIFVDIDDLNAITTIKHNRILMDEGHGISVRGNLELHPPLIIEGNDLVLSADTSCSHIIFSVMHSQHVKIIGNKFSGGAYGVSFDAEPYPPVDYLVRDNLFFKLSKSLFYFSQSGIADLKGLSVESNQVCSSSPAYIEWKSGVKVREAKDVERALGVKSINEIKCQ